MFKELTLFFYSSSVQNIYSNAYIHMNNTFTIFICKADATNLQDNREAKSSVIAIWKLYSRFTALKCRMSCFILPWQCSLR